MSQATGCISVAAEVEGVRLDRIIESVHPDPLNRTCKIWADIFAANSTDQPQKLFLMHRGGLRARNTTRTWSSAFQGIGEDDETVLTKRLITLREQRDPITQQENAIVVGATRYELSIAPQEPTLIIGDTEHDVPYTMWQFGPLPPKRRSLIRLELTLSNESYDQQIGPETTFWAYGEGILLNMIEREDLFWFDGPDADQYRERFQQFKRAEHLVPDFFEYVIVTLPTASYAQWEATPLSPRLYAEPIPPALKGTTHWFITDHRHGDTWSLVGKRYNGLVIKLHAKEANYQPCAVFA